VEKRFASASEVIEGKREGFKKAKEMVMPVSRKEKTREIRRKKSNQPGF